MRKKIACLIKYEVKILTIIFFIIKSNYCFGQKNKDTIPNFHPSNFNQHFFYSQRKITTDTVFFNTRNNIVSKIKYPKLTSFIADSINKNANKKLSITENTFSVTGAFTISVVSTNTTCNNSNGTFTINVSGGVAPYTFSENGYPYQSSNYFFGKSAGVYNIIVKDAIGSTTSTTITLTNTFTPPTLNVESYTNAMACTGMNGSITLIATGGTPPYSFTDDGLTYQSSNVFNNLSRGYFSFLVYDVNGCEAPVVGGFFYGLDCTLFSYGLSYSAYTCISDGAISVSGLTGGTPPYQFSIDGINYQSSPDFTNLKAGIYHLYLKDAAGNEDIHDVQIFEGCPLDLLANVTDVTCGKNDGSISITANNGTIPYSYSIDGINFQNGNTFSNLSPGIYSVTVRDADGAYGYINSVNVNSNCLQLTLQNTNTTCGSNNGSITANASGGTSPYQYSLMQTSGFVSSNLFTGLTAGTYTIFAKDANGITTNANVTITDAASPNINIALTPASCTNTNGSINITANGGTSPFEFSINNGNTFQSSNVFNNLDSAQYIALIKDANGCIVSDTVQLTALATPAFSIGNDTILCNGETLLLSAPQVAGYQYLWQDNSTLNNFNVTTQGSYTVKITNQFNCSASSTINVKFNGVPNFSLGPDTTICNSKTILLQPVGVLSQVNYLWNTGATSSSINTNVAGLYWLQITNDGCAKRDSIIIISKPNPIINLGDDTTLCAGQTILLNASNNNAVYTWQDGSSGPTFEVNKAGSYTVDVKENGCDTSGKITINYINKPIINIGKDTSICITEKLLLDATYPSSIYIWQDGSTNAQFTVTQPGNYAVDVSNVCGDTKDSINVMYENCACKFYMPSAFTPNTDGRNDVFIPKYQCQLSNYELKIFNRWGQLVFNSINISNGWDGNFNNRQQPIGTYIWKVSYKDNITGIAIHKNGTVVLIR